MFSLCFIRALDCIAVAGSRQPLTFSEHVIKTAVAIDAFVTWADCETMHWLCTGHWELGVQL